jgi:hypothetical protein
MLYPGYQPPAEPWPAVLHYGITYNVDDYAFDKHWYMGSDFTSCPGRIFNKPMLPEELNNKPGSVEYRRKTVALTVADTLYEATKWWSGHHCNSTLPDMPRQSYTCSTMSNGVISCREIKDKGAQSELLQRLRGGGPEVEQSEICKEDNFSCCAWAAQGECEKNPSFMLGSCQRSCNLCGGGCREGCCPLQQLNAKEEKEEYNPPSQKERRDDDTIRSPQVAFPVPVPPLVGESGSDVATADTNVAMLDIVTARFKARAEAGKTWQWEDQRIETMRATGGQAARVPGSSTGGDTEEELEETDYDQGMFGLPVLQRNTLLAFVTGSLFSLFVMNVVPSSRRGHVTYLIGMGSRLIVKEKGSQ